MKDSGLGPPWIIYADKGKSVAILPAGRPGEVANVEALPDATVRAIVEAANSGERGAFSRLEHLSERVIDLAILNGKLEVLRELQDRATGGPPGIWRSITNDLIRELEAGKDGK